MTTRDNQPVRQHFVPKSFLRNFCNGDGRIYHCILRPGDDQTIRPRWFQGFPETLGFEKNLYTLSDKEQSDPYAVERHLAEIDANGIEAIRDCLSEHRDRIPLRSEPDLRRYIATLANRVPSALRFKAGLDPYMKQGMIQGLPNHMGPHGIRADTEYVAEQLAQFIIYPEYYDASVPCLLTSDRPVSLYSLGSIPHGRVEQPAPVSASLPDCWKGDVVAVLPISSHCALFAIRGSKRLLKQIVNDQLQVGACAKRAGWVNAMTAFDANHLYACSRELQFLLPHDPQHHSQQGNCLGSLEQFLTAAEKAMQATTIAFPPTDL